MNIEKQFNLIAKEYDINRKKFIPCFDEFYVKTTDFLADNISNPKRILDLGAGTGILSAIWYEHFPEAEYVLVDIAEEMLDIARERFSGLANVDYKSCDYSVGLPDGEYDVIISALSIHHLEDIEKAELFEKIYYKLPKNGVFINYDQFCADQLEINVWLNKYWVKQLEQSGLTEQDLELWHKRRKLDKECSVETEVSMIKNCNFESVKCVYSNQKFSVIAAVK